MSELPVELSIVCNHCADCGNLDPSNHLSWLAFDRKALSFNSGHRRWRARQATIKSDCFQNLRRVLRNTRVDDLSFSVDLEAESSINHKNDVNLAGFNLPKGTIHTAIEIA